jgi:hypothetical protein
MNDNLAASSSCAPGGRASTHPIGDRTEQQ